MGAPMFPIIYFGTLGIWFTLDQFHLLNPWSDKSAWDMFPKRETAWASKFSDSSLQLVLFSMFVMTPILFAWRSFLKRYVFGALAEKCAGAKVGTKLHDKFVEQAWLALHYALVSALGAYVLHDKPWFPPVLTKQARFALVPTVREREADQEDVGLKIWYLVQLGFYFMELVTLLANKENRSRSDAGVYLFHHVYTVFLMFGGWLSLDQRFGTMTLFLHDVGDVFLPVGKCFTYSEAYVRENKSKATLKLVEVAGLASFVMFIILFAIPRLFFFGGLTFSAIYELEWGKCCGYDAITNACLPCPAPYFTAVLVGVLGLLWPMHVFWFYLIVKMAYRVLFGKYQDVRSDEEDDEPKRKKRA